MALFRELPLTVQEWLRSQARETILRMLERELAKCKGKMGTPPIRFPPDLGIAEAFIVVRNAKTKKAFAGLDPDLPVLVYARRRWDKASRERIETWADTAAIAIAGHQYGAGAEQVFLNRAAGEQRMRGADFGTEPKELDLARMENALDQWLRQVDPAWLAQEKAKYPGFHIVKVPPGTPAPISWRRDLHLPSAKPLAVGLALLHRYLKGDPQYDAFRGALHIPPLTIVGEQLPALLTIPGARDRVPRLAQYDQDQYDATLWELAVAARYLALGHEVAFLPETPGRKTPDLQLMGRKPDTFIECKRSSVYAEYDLKERAEWHRICDPIMQYLHAHPLEVDVEVQFLLPLEDITSEEVFSAFRTIAGATRSREVVNQRFCLAVRPLPPLVELPHPVSQASPAAPRMLFGVEDDGSVDGLSAVILPKAVSPDGLWLHSIYRRACLRWKSCSFAALQRKARGVLLKLIGGAAQIPEGSHGILHLAAQEWTRSDVREVRWAKILEELDGFYHSAKIRLPYLFLNRLIIRVSDGGGPDIEENCTILRHEKVGDPAEADRLPHLIFTAE